MMTRYPRVKSVQALDDKRLLVTFDNGDMRLYDCKPLLAQAVFAPLAAQWLFKSVKVDQGGYGISWNDAIDLSEAELWEGGVLVEAAR